MAEVNKLLLGPIVGHTDEQSVRIWIRTIDDPASYSLLIHTIGFFAFVSTEPNFEFGTAIVIAQGLKPHRKYRYKIQRLGRSLPNAIGTFTTKPPIQYLNETSFIAISCNDQADRGAWEMLKEFIDDTQPRFLLMMGDQVYFDQATNIPNLWETYRDRPTEQRRLRMAEKYQESWSRPYVREVMANIPCYMMWDDHDIRDGWGSFAPDSPTLAKKYPKGRNIHDKYASFFQDARDVFWHFQMSHNPPPLINNTIDPIPVATYGLSAPQFNNAQPSSFAFPFTFRAGRVAVIVLDSRGDRDLWREKYPVLGASQWKYLNEVVEQLPTEIEGTVFVTPTPIVCMAPKGMSQLTVGGRTDDITYFRNGQEALLDEMFTTSGTDTDWQTTKSLYTGLVSMSSAAAGIPINYGNLKLEDLDDIRDQWSHNFSRPEQGQLIRLAIRSRTTNRSGGNPRGLLFVGGDLHVGGLYRIDITEPECSFECLISSGISRNAKSKFPGFLGTLVDEEFDVAEGIRTTLQYLINSYNFGSVTIISNGKSTELLSHVVHSGGESSVDGWRLKIERPTGVNRALAKIKSFK
jgi:hypothetical protein